MNTYQINGTFENRTARITLRSAPATDADLISQAQTKVPGFTGTGVTQLFDFTLPPTGGPGVHVAPVGHNTASTVAPTGGPSIIPAPTGVNRPDAPLPPGVLPQ